VGGFLKGDHARGRPVGVAFDPTRRALYVADDVSNTVWRVAPKAAARAEAVAKGAREPS